MASVIARTFADFFRTYRHDRAHAMPKLNVTVTHFKRLERNTLVGFVIVYIREMRMKIRDVAVHEKAGQRWVQLPARPQIDKDGCPIRDQATGKIAYSSLMEFDSPAVRDAFSGAVITALLEHEPTAFERAA